METFILYLIKSSLNLSLLIIFYRISLKKESYFLLNRLFLLVSILSSVFFFPFLKAMSILPIRILPQISDLQVIALNPIVVYANKSSSHNALLLIFITYFSIVGILLIRFAFQIMQIIRLYLQSKSIQSTSDYLYIDDHPPFSFFHLIFINTNNNINDTARIITHEKVHVKQYHTIDILLVEMLCILHWFNPFVWWYRTSIREVHEYIADQGVINSGYEKLGYQSLLLSVATGSNMMKPENNFNSLIKKRIIMMTKPKSNGISLAKYLLMLPLFIILSLSATLETNDVYANIKDELSISQQTTLLTSIIPYKKQTTENSQQKPKKMKAGNDVFTVVEVQPEFIGGENAMMNFIKENVSYPKEAREKGIEGTVYVTFVVETNGNVSKVKVIRGVNLLIDKESIRVVKLMTGKWKPGMQKGKAVRVQFNLPIKFALEKKEDKSNK